MNILILLNSDDHVWPVDRWICHSFANGSVAKNGFSIFEWLKEIKRVMQFVIPKIRNFNVHE